MDALWPDARTILQDRKLVREASLLIRRHRSHAYNADRVLAALCTISVLFASSTTLVIDSRAMPNAVLSVALALSMHQAYHTPSAVQPVMVIVDGFVVEDERKSLKLISEACDAALRRGFREFTLAEACIALS